jgi:hypothetical protein
LKCTDLQGIGERAAEESLFVESLFEESLFEDV